MIKNTEMWIQTGGTVADTGNRTVERNTSIIYLIRLKFAIMLYRFRER